MKQQTRAKRPPQDCQQAHLHLAPAFKFCVYRLQHPATMMSVVSSSSSTARSSSSSCHSSLQLIPFDSASSQFLVGRGHHPLLQLNVRGVKRLSSLISAVCKKWMIHRSALRLIQVRASGDNGVFDYGSSHTSADVGAVLHYHILSKTTAPETRKRRRNERAVPSPPPTPTSPPSAPTHPPLPPAASSSWFDERILLHAHSPPPSPSVWSAAVADQQTYNEDTFGLPSLPPIPLAAYASPQRTITRADSRERNGADDTKAAALPSALFSPLDWNKENAEYRRIAAAAAALANDYSAGADVVTSFRPKRRIKCDQPGTEQEKSGSAALNDWNAHGNIAD